MGYVIRIKSRSTDLKKNPGNKAQRSAQGILVHSTADRAMNSADNNVKNVVRRQYLSNTLIFHVSNDSVQSGRLIDYDLIILNYFGFLSKILAMNGH